MAKKKKPPEQGFQDHIATFLVRVHGYRELAQTEITDARTSSSRTTSGPS
jgi:hypothetical protein